MTGQPLKESQFEPRADNAALQLKAQLNQEQGLSLPSRQVEVGPDGKPPPPLPPEGSYARQAIEQQRAAAQQQSSQAMGQPTQQQVLGQQPPAGTVEQAIDGSQAPPLSVPGQPPQEPGDPNFSVRANERFAKLSQDLREADRERQAAIAEVKELKASEAETKAMLEALRAQHQQMLQANLDNLDPETRMQVMQDARMQEYFASFKQDILNTLQPQIQGLQENRVHNELMALSEKYPRFDVQIHGPQIEMFRGKYPEVPIEQAYKAIAEPEELVTRGAASHAAVPPILAPGGTAPANTRYVAEPQSDPEQEMREESLAWKKLLASADPADQRAGARLLEKNMGDRLGDNLPGAARR